MSVPAELAIKAIPVFDVPPTETGTDTDREVTVVALFADAEKAGCRYRADTVTFPLENTFAKPAVKSPLLCVLIVIDPPGGTRNGILGRVIAAGISDPLGRKKTTSPCTAEVVDEFPIVIAEIQSAPPVTCATLLTTGNICERATPPANVVV